MELAQELIREAGHHLPLRIGPGGAIVAGKLLVLILVQVGFVSPLPAVATVAVAFATLGMQTYELIYIWRFWRLAVLIGAGVLGFYGMAVVLFVLMVYLYQIDSYGVPFFGETGFRFSATGLASSWQQRRKSGANAGQLR